MTKNTYYCTECGQGCEETCRDCGTDADVLEICGHCGEVMDNCECEDDHDCSPAGPVG